MYVVVGSRVKCGDGADHDTGVVQQLDGDNATVGWDSGVVTTCLVSDLTLTAERWSGGIPCHESGRF